MTVVDRETSVSSQIGISHVRRHIHIVWTSSSKTWHRIVFFGAKGAPAATAMAKVAMFLRLQTGEQIGLLEAMLKQCRVSESVGDESFNCT
jgi:hypothetical protein